ncbi:MAG: C45 family peptidase [Actinomycetota bacterium]
MTIDEALTNDASGAPAEGRMPVIRVAGDAGARGRQQGEAMRDSIGRCIEIYDATFQLPDDEVARRAAHFEAVTRAWHPTLAAEVDGIAAASGHPHHWLWALNARSEIMSYTGAEESECTSVWSPTTNILAQNWDWMASLEPITVALDATHEDGHHVVTVTEPGIVGKVGMSSAGTAVGLNFLFSPEQLDGVPVHVLLRALLDARSSDEVETLLETAGAGRSAHVFLANADGVGSSIEYTGTRMWRSDSSTDPLLHTNHFVNGGDAAAELPQGAGADNSEARYDRSVEFVAEHGVETEADVRGLLDDRGNAEFPICRPWKESPTLPGVETGTVCAIVMRLADAEIDIRLGPDPAGSWQTHTV